MNSRSLIRIIIYLIVVVLIIAGINAAAIYTKAYSTNIRTPGKKPVYIHIPTGSEYEDVLQLIYEQNLISNKKSFEWAADKKNYASHIHPGRYLIRDNMSNNELINILRSGLQEPVNVTINNARTVEELAQKISVQIEAGTDELLQLLTDSGYIREYGFERQTVLGMFLPNTYEFWWNTSADGFFKRMNKEYNKFWNQERRGRAREINLTGNQVITLASIIVNETNKEDEYRRIAGVYINRLNQGMRLQADPTIKYALGDYARRRVLRRDTYIDSPYNTYLHYGLPPGPIALPSVKAIDAVLDYERHSYVYFCAKEDFSGYHNFARTLEQHNKNARLYQKALNRRNILR
jgi:UPF0755 protein